MKVGSEFFYKMFEPILLVCLFVLMGLIMHGHSKGCIVGKIYLII